MEIDAEALTALTTSMNALTEALVKENAAREEASKPDEINPLDVALAVAEAKAA